MRQQNNYILRILKLKRWRGSKIRGVKSATAAIPLEKLLEQLPDTYTLADKELIQRAYRVAEEAHRGQKRNSGEPYINHCLAVGQILAELRVPPEVLAAGLLHDTVEDTKLTLDDIHRDFGDTIASLVDGVTKLTNLPRVSRDDQHAEKPAGGDGMLSPASATGQQNLIINPISLGRRPDMASETLRKTFLAMGDDVRVVLIKLADRLHNMRTLGHMPEEKRKRIAQQTLDIFAPLANRLGIWQIKWELEDLAFRYVNPAKYKEIAEQLAERRPDRESQIQGHRGKPEKAVRRTLHQGGDHGETQAYLFDLQENAGKREGLRAGAGCARRAA